jgi:hypothetical protein
VLLGSYWQFTCKYLLDFKGKRVPVCFIQNDNFMPTWWQSDLLLRKCLDFISHDVDSSDAISVSVDTRESQKPGTFHQTHSIPIHPPYMRPPVVDGLNNVCL